MAQTPNVRPFEITPPMSTVQVDVVKVKVRPVPRWLLEKAQEQQRQLIDQHGTIALELISQFNRELDREMLGLPPLRTGDTLVFTQKVTIT